MRFQAGRVGFSSQVSGAACGQKTGAEGERDAQECTRAGERHSGEDKGRSHQEHDCGKFDRRLWPSQPLSWSCATALFASVKSRTAGDSQSIATLFTSAHRKVKDGPSSVAEGLAVYEAH